MVVRNILIIYKFTPNDAFVVRSSYIRISVHVDYISKL